MKKLLIFLFILLFPFSAISAPTNIPDVLITDVNNPNWVDVRRFTDIEPGLTALANKTATLRITKDVMLDNTYGAGIYSGVIVHIMPGFTCTITNPATYGFNVIVEDQGVLAIDDNITIAGNLTIKGVPAASVVKITGNEILTVSGSYNINSTLYVAGISNLRLTVPIKAGDIRHLTHHTNLFDGGEGDFIWDATSVVADNNGTVIQVTGVTPGRWIRQTSGGIYTPEMFGCYGDNTHDDTTAFLNFMTFIQGKTGKFSGLYKITSPMVIDTNYTSIIGVESPGAFRDIKGPGINYTGVGVGLLIGIAPDISGDFIYGTKISNLRVLVASNTSKAMRVWQSIHGRYDTIRIYGNKGVGTVGLQTDGGVDNIYTQVEVNGQGNPYEITTSSYVATGLLAGLGHLNQPATTTIFKNCYFHYCNIAATIAGVYKFEGCIFEASNIGTNLGLNSMAEFMQCWWEANQSADFYMSATKVTVVGGTINSYAREHYIDSSGVVSAIFRDVDFSSDHASPKLVNPVNNFLRTGDDSRCILSGCSLPANFTLGGAQGTDSTRLINTDLSVVTYKFKAAAVSGTTTVTAVPTEMGALSVALPMNANILSVRVSIVGATGGGTYDIGTKINGSNSPQFSYPTIPLQSSDILIDGKYYDSRVAKNDLLSFYLHTTSIINPVDFIIEITCALGNDGIGLEY